MLLSLKFTIPELDSIALLVGLSPLLTKLRVEWFTFNFESKLSPKSKVDPVESLVELVLIWASWIEIWPANFLLASIPDWLKLLKFVSPPLMLSWVVESPPWTAIPLLKLLKFNWPSLLIVSAWPLPRDASISISFCACPGAALKSTFLPFATLMMRPRFNFKHSVKSNWWSELKLIWLTLASLKAFFKSVNVNESSSTFTMPLFAT